MIKMKELIQKLNDATKAYDYGKPYMSDTEWDELYFQLQALEKETGIIYPDSPTHNIYFDKVSELSKVQHQYTPMLSLDKTKSPQEIKSFCFAYKNHYDWFAMFKMDGLSCRLTYVDGKLIRGETRGNGIEGEDITHNIKTISNIPLVIPSKEKIIVIDGEIICSRDCFEEFKEEYKTPRNFAAGSIRLLDAAECSTRKLSFIAWDFIKGCENIINNFFRLKLLDEWGFSTVPRVRSVETVHEAIAALDDMRYNQFPYYNYPIDGYVFKFENRKFCESLGRTEHHFKSAIAFKFYDEEYETELVDIEWSMGRTGILTPVAVFNPIIIDGTEVTRASLCNISIMKQTLGNEPFKGQKVYVTKRNQIIPKIEKAKDINGKWIN